MIVSLKDLFSKSLKKMENRRRFTSRYQSHPDQALTGVAENGRAAKAGPYQSNCLPADGNSTAKPGWA